MGRHDPLKIVHFKNPVVLVYLTSDTSKIAYYFGKSSVLFYQEDLVKNQHYQSSKFKKFDTNFTYLQMVCCLYAHLYF